MPEVPEMALVRPEGERADGGVQAVGADHQVEAARDTAREGDVDTVRVLLKRVKQNERIL